MYFVYSTFCRASRWQPVVDSGFSAAGQLVTLVYRGKINDLTLWVEQACTMGNTPPFEYDFLIGSTGQERTP